MHNIVAGNNVQPTTAPGDDCIPEREQIFLRGHFLHFRLLFVRLACSRQLHFRSPLDVSKKTGGKCRLERHRSLRIFYQDAKFFWDQTYVTLKVIHFWLNSALDK